MKIKILYVSILLLALFQVTFAQTEEMSDSARVLADKVEAGDTRSILEAGRSGDKTLIPYLKTLTSKHSSWAQMALAKLGEAEYLDQILSEVDEPSYGVQNSAIAKLAYVGDKKAFRKLFELLDDTAPRGEEECKKETEKAQKNHLGERCGLCCDVMVFSRASQVTIVLSKTIADPPVRTSYGLEKHIQIWKKWFEEHRELMQ